MAFKTSSKQKLSTISAIASSVGTGASGPVILSVAITDSSYVNLDDTAVSTSGGYIKLIGTGFVTGCVAYVNGVALTTTFVSSTEVRAVIPALASGTYSLMLFNSAGSGAIWATGLTASGFPTVTTSAYANSGNVLNIQLLASGDGTLVYSLQSGSTLPVGVTLSSGGLLSGTASALTSATVVSFTILVNDAQLQTVQQAITVSLTFGDIYFNSTTLAIQADTTPFISDASANSLVLTPSGSVKADQSNPFQEGFYSGFFNNSVSDVIKVTSNATAFAIGTGNFTVEGWFNSVDYTHWQHLFHFGGSGHYGIVLYRDNSNSLIVQIEGTTVINYAFTPVLSTWYHFALVRAGTGSNQTTLYLNGVSVATGTSTGNISADNIFIGGIDWGTGNNWSGYISNLRIIKGVALYTEAFTSPTQPLTTTEPAVTYVAPATVDYLVVAGGGGGGSAAGGGGGAGGLLTGTGFAVAANTALTITVGTGGAGSTAAANLGSAGGNSVFSTITAIGGGGGQSNQNGTVTTGGSGGGAAGTGGANVTPGNGTAGQGYAGGTRTVTSPTFGSGGGGGAGGVGGTGTGIAGGAGGIGLSSSISGISTYYAGGGGGGTYNANPGWGVGGLGGGGLASSGIGYSGISNTGGGGGGGGTSDANPQAGGAGGSGVVIVRYADTSSPAVTTGNPDITVTGGYRIYKFTQSGTIKFRNTSSPAVTAAQTVLLTCQNNRFKDSSTLASAITVAGTPKITQVVPYNLPTTTSGSMYMTTGTSDYVILPNTTALAMSTGDFTIEGWVYPLSTGQLTMVCLTTNLQIFTYNNSFYIYDNGTQTAGGTVVLNTWLHFAVVRSGTSLKGYVNGVQVISVTSSSNFASGSNYLGFNTGSVTNGYISNLRIVKGTAVYTSAFTPPIAPLTAVSGTSLLTLQTKSAHNNNTYQETSSYNNLLTVAGTPSQGTFSPFSPSGWSNYFTAATDYLTTAPTTMSAAGFTVECWVNTTNKTAYAGLCKNGAAADWTVSDIYVIGLDASGNSIWIYNASSSISLNGTTTVTDGKWHHVAFVYNGTNYKLYIDGVENATVTAAAMTQTARVHNIGCDIRNSRPWVGYISNFRMVNGTAIYTAAFTPSITTLTAVTGTVILTCQDNRFVDNSRNALTVAGTPKIQAFSPFKPSAAYDPVIHGGSTYFNSATTDYFSIPTTPVLTFGTGDFTLECWMYLLAVPVGSVEIFQHGNFHLNFRNVTPAQIAITNDASVLSGLSNAIPLYTWTHIAAVRASGTMTIYVNGVPNTPATGQTYAFTQGSSNINASNAAAGTFANMYISNMHVIKGFAKYTSNFYVPTAPVTRTASTVLLLDSTSAAITDASGRNNMRTVGDAKISTAVKKYGTGSMSFDGTGDYLVIPSSTNYGYGTGDFTIEFWLYLNAVGTQTIVSSLTSTASINTHIYYSTGSGLRYFTNGADRIVGTALATNTFYHIALSRAASSTKLFINGVQTGSTYTDTNNYGTTAPLVVGTYYSSGTTLEATGGLNGYIDDLRVTKGVARYVANFTPPVAISVS